MVSLSASLQRPSFNPKALHMRPMVNKLAQIFNITHTMRILTININKRTYNKKNKIKLP